jgi:ATP-dependent DNA ligase
VLLGFYREGQLRFCASVRNGFVPASRRSLHAKLKDLETDKCPFANLPETGPGRWGDITASRMRECVWLRPGTVAQFRFLEWTPSEHLRHVSFLGLREDKAPLDVVKEGEHEANKRPPKTATGQPVKRKATA